MEKLEMCDKKSIVWCGRISLLCTICSVLCVMMFQIWTYYFSLVAQMDNLVLESPHIHALLKLCTSNIVESWNLDACVSSANQTCCELVPSDGGRFFADVSGNSLVSMNGTSICMTHTTQCSTSIFWILPW